MLTGAERTEIDAESRRYPERRAACIEALKVVQRRCGWVTDDALFDVADFLGMSPAELDGVATFYNLIFRQPVGRHVVLICDSVSCWVMGEEGLREQLSSRLGLHLGGTTPDGRFTLLPTVCLGACDRAPAFMIDDDLFGEVDESQLDSILERYL